MKYDNILIALDMLGCPNRCRHCFVGWRPNSKLSKNDLVSTAEAWELCNKLSSKPPEHYELASVWRLARDEGYAPWLKSLDVKYVQLTLFGGEELTDYFTGRKGAYQDILKAIDVLLENVIAPRIQA